ncbi:MAG: hypothetical protein ABTA16_18650, partial [Niallia sp.]
KNNVITLTNLRHDIYEQLVTKVNCWEIKSSYFAIINYLNKQVKVEDRMDVFPTILTGNLVSPEWNLDEKTNGVIELFKNQKALACREDNAHVESNKSNNLELQRIISQVVHEYWLVYERKREQTVIQISLPNIKYTRDLETKIKELFFPSFHQVQGATFFYEDGLYINNILVKRPRKKEKVDWGELLFPLGKHRGY